MTKDNDWTGDKNSIFKTLGASNHSNQERETNDFYATDPSAIDRLVKKIDLPKQILEPACGAGHLSIRLEELGHNVYSSDLIDRGFGHVQDFFAMQEPPFAGDYAIVTNPPYKYAKEFVLHALELVPVGSLVCMFLKTTFAEGKGRFNSLFRIYPPTRFYSVWSASYAPKTRTSQQGRRKAVQSLMLGGYGKKVIMDRQF